MILVYNIIIIVYIYRYGIYSIQTCSGADLFYYSILIDNIIMSNKDGVSTSELKKAVLNKEHWNELEMITGECSKISKQSLSLFTPKQLMISDNS